MAEACCFSGNYIPRQVRNFCLFHLHDFCSVLTAPNWPGPLEGIRLEEHLPIEELAGTAPSFSKQEKKPYFAKTKGWRKRKYAQLIWLYQVNTQYAPNIL